MATSNKNIVRDTLKALMQTNRRSSQRGQVRAVNIGQRTAQVLLANSRGAVTMPVASKDLAEEMANRLAAGQDISASINNNIIVGLLGGASAGRSVTLPNQGVARRPSGTSFSAQTGVQTQAMMARRSVNSNDNGAVLRGLRSGGATREGAPIEPVEISTTGETSVATGSTVEVNWEAVSDINVVGYRLRVVWEDGTVEEYTAAATEQSKLITLNNAGTAQIRVAAVGAGGADSAWSEPQFVMTFIDITPPPPAAGWTYVSWQQPQVSSPDLTFSWGLPVENRDDVARWLIRIYDDKQIVRLATSISASQSTFTYTYAQNNETPPAKRSLIIEVLSQDAQGNEGYALRQPVNFPYVSISAAPAPTLTTGPGMLSVAVPPPPATVRYTVLNITGRSEDYVMPAGQLGANFISPSGSVTVKYKWRDWFGYDTQLSTGATTTVTAPGGASGFLTDLTDVTIATPSNGQALIYESASSQWKNLPIAGGGGGATNLDALTDVTIASPVASQVLSFNGSLWVNADPTGGGGTDTHTVDTVAPPGPVPGDVWLDTDQPALVPLTSEDVDDRVNALLMAGTGITKTYDDAANTLTLSSLTDHGLLIGLTDDDHPQYHTNVRGDARYPLKTNNLSDLANAATARSNLGAAATVHQHAGTDITSGVVAPTQLGVGTPTTSTYLRGDGSWQVIVPGVHQHAAQDITTGVMAVARLGTGTPTAENYLAGDGTWKTPAGGTGGGGGATTLDELTDATIASPTDGQVLTYETATSQWKNKAATGGGAGVTDHGALTGLGDDDHTQYLTNTRGDARYPLKTNNLSDLANVATARTNLGAAAASHVHAGSDITTGTVPAARLGSGAPSASNYLRGDGSWQVLTPGVTAHAALTGLSADDHAQYHTDTRGDARYPLKTNNLSDLANTATARTNLGAAAATHTHAAADTTSGVFGVARLGTGTPTASNYLRGDGAWTTPPAVITDHGALGGLADDDHPQYNTQARGDARYPLKTNNLSDLANTTTARTNIGAAAATHAHAGADITSGTVPVARLGTGTPTATNYLAGDGTWKTPAGGGGGGATTLDGLDDAAIANPTNGQLLIYNATEQLWKNWHYSHGDLWYRDADDHVQYHNDARGDARYSQLGHTHPTEISFMFSANGAAYYVTTSACTITLGQEGGTGTLTYAIAPDNSATFGGNVTLPQSLTTGQTLRVTVAGIATFKAVTLVKT
jgi:hypothetical protein